MSDTLFAYGTLRPGHAPDEIAPAVEKLRRVGEGFVTGVLYDLGNYPGAVLDPSSTQKIFGAVLHLPEDADFLDRLDAYEGFDPLAPERSLFVRKLHPVTLTTGRVLQCWIYVYNGAPEPSRIVKSGR